jgi:hypothetical protein
MKRMKQVNLTFAFEVRWANGIFRTIFMTLTILLFVNQFTIVINRTVITYYVVIVIN